MSGAGVLNSEFKSSLCILNIPSNDVIGLADHCDCDITLLMPNVKESESSNYKTKFGGKKSQLAFIRYCEILVPVGSHIKSLKMCQKCVKKRTVQ